MQNENWETFENWKHVQYKMDSEGIGYFLTCYCNFTDMPDQESQRLFKEACEAIEKFESYINSKV